MVVNQGAEQAKTNSHQSVWMLQCYGNSAASKQRTSFLRGKTKVKSDLLHNEDGTEKKKEAFAVKRHKHAILNDVHINCNHKLSWG